MSNDIILKIIELLVLVIITLASRYFIPWLREHVNVLYVDEVIYWSEIFVKSAEMLFKGDKMGDEKLEFVTDLMNQMLGKLGIRMTDDEIRAIIENSVYKLKQGE